jgi:hemolysin III
MAADRQEFDGKHAGCEILADRIVHTIGVGGGLVGGIALLAMAALSPASGTVAPVAVYVAGLMAMLLCSALYHVHRYRPHGHHRWRDRLQRLDHAAIFAMIAGTYTPLALLALARPWNVIVTASVWAVAAVGIVLKLVRPRAVQRLSVPLYLLQGWMGLFALRELVAALSPATLALVLAGGLVYSGGIVLHLSSRRYSVALWHCCVLSGAGCHYAAIASLIRL